MREGLRPPRLPALLVRVLLSRSDADRLMDALDEEYVAHQVGKRGRTGATLWYWRQVLRSIPPLVRRNLRLRWAGRRGDVARSGRSDPVNSPRVWRHGGGLPAARPRQSAARVHEWLAASRLDLHHLLRVLRQARASSLATILSLVLTLGAGASILAVVDQVLLSPPPFADPEALVVLSEVPLDDMNAAPRAVGSGTLVVWRDRAATLAALEAFDPTNLTLTGAGTAERVSATAVTPDFLAVLGVDPVIGRRFAENDAGQPVVIIGARFWRVRMGSDPAVLGSELVLGGRAHVIVGVLPESFFFALNAGDVWLPLPNVAGAGDDGFPVRVLARLAPGVSATRLEAALNDAGPVSRPPATAKATPLASAIIGGSGRTLIALALAAVLAIVIAFINLTVLLLLRSIERRRELAVREAIGARPSEAAKQLLLEAVALVGVGIAGGAAVAGSITPAVGRFAVEFGGLSDRAVTVGWRTVAIVGAAALACACVCALVSSRGSRRRRIVDALRRGATSTSHEIAMRRAFVAGEVALAFVLMVSMTLPGRSLLDLLSVDPGFVADGVLKLQVSLPSSEYGDRGRAAAFYSSLQDALSHRLGAGTTAIVNEAPLTGDGGRTLVTAPGTGRSVETVVRSASPEYFDVMRIPVASGRGFDRGDDAPAAARAVITESLARRLFAEGDAVGRSILVDGQEQSSRVVGVVGDVKHRTLEEPVLSTLYVPARQFPSPSSILVVRSSMPDASVIATVREEVARLDRNLPVYGIRSMRDVVAASPGVPARRLLVVALAAFALLALLLSTIGLFGIAAHDAARRRAEMALRAALGASPSSIAASTLAHGAAVIGAGLAAGCLLSVGAVRALATVLPAPDPGAVIGTGAVTALILAVTCATAILPVALRAAGSDPLRTLRAD